MNEAIANIREAMALCVEVMQERGEPIPIDDTGADASISRCKVPPVPSLRAREIVRVLQKHGFALSPTAR